MSCPILKKAELIILGGTWSYYHRSEEHTSELQSHLNLVCRLLLEKKNQHPKAGRSEARVLRSRPQPGSRSAVVNTLTAPLRFHSYPHPSTQTAPRPAVRPISSR